jgi:hypothetical protein
MATTVTVITGYYDQAKQSWQSSNADTWADVTSWTTWTRWNSDPQGVEIQLDDDLGSNDLRVTELICNYNGTATFTLKVSTTGLFAGEETTYNFAAGTNYSIASGRYYRWTVEVQDAADGLVPEIFSAISRYSNSVATEYLRLVDTSTLSGTISARTVTHPFGSVYSCDITAHDSTTWIDRFYAVPDSYSVSTISPVPGIVSLSPLTIVLRDHFGVPVNGIVNIAIQGQNQVTVTAGGVSIL